MGAASFVVRPESGVSALSTLPKKKRNVKSKSTKSNFHSTSLKQNTLFGLTLRRKIKGYTIMYVWSTLEIPKVNLPIFNKTGLIKQILVDREEINEALNKICSFTLSALRTAESSV